MKSEPGTELGLQPRLRRSLGLKNSVHTVFQRPRLPAAGSCSGFPPVGDEPEPPFGLNQNYISHKSQGWDYTSHEPLLSPGSVPFSHRGS